MPVTRPSCRLAATSSLFDPLIEQRTLDIIRGVERDGDKAVLITPDSSMAPRLRH